MTSYLITWKPDTENAERGWPEKELVKLARELESSGIARETWRFAKRKGVRVGERVYLLRQGKRGHAILGYGVVDFLPKPSDSGTPIAFKALVEPGSNLVLATQNELHSLTRKYWNTHTSGITLDPSVASHLEELVTRGPIADPMGSGVKRMRASNPDWTRDEHIVALAFYLKHRPTPPNKGTEAIRRLSQDIRRIGEKLLPKAARSDTFRNENGVYMKLMNFRRLDPNYTADGRKGLSRGADGEEDVWAEFSGDLDRCSRTAQLILGGVESLEAAGIESLGDDSDGIVDAAEGRVLTTVHVVRERNPRLVRSKKRRVRAKTGMLACEACGFEFEVRYGKHGEDFIECHHTKPVATLTGGEKTHLDDLALLCANCHRMIHRTKPWLTLLQLKAILRA